MSCFKAWNVPLDINRRHLKPSLKKITGGMPSDPPELRSLSAGVRRKPRLRAESNTRFGVRIFILPDSNFFSETETLGFAHWAPPQNLSIITLLNYCPDVKIVELIGTVNAWKKICIYFPIKRATLPRPSDYINDANIDMIRDPATTLPYTYGLATFKPIHVDIYIVLNGSVRFTLLKTWNFDKNINSWVPSMQ